MAGLVPAIPVFLASQLAREKFVGWVELFAKPIASLAER
jgi:hypothetical protein